MVTRHSRYVKSSPSYRRAKVQLSLSEKIFWGVLAIVLIFSVWVAMLVTYPF